jgi:hypothetical protein
MADWWHRESNARITMVETCILCLTAKGQTGDEIFTNRWQMNVQPAMTLANFKNLTNRKQKIPTKYFNHSFFNHSP